MNTRTLFIVLCIAASAAAVPSIRVRRSENSTAPDCGSGTPTELSGLLAQVGNLLDNILANVSSLKVAGLLGSGNLIDLSNLLGQVRRLLTTLLGGATLADNDTPENRHLLSSLIGQITDLLDNLLGDGTGRSYACTNNGGLVGNLLGSIVNGVLGPILAPILNLIGVILRTLV